MKDEIMVSICCIAYNQEKYIGRTLEGFINQKTTFKYEVLINDDASSDNTANIIKEYSDKYPEIIKPIFQIENQYKKGISNNVKFNYPRAKGKYIALCEGDDYWNDPYKLQTQYDALEKNKHCSISVHQTQCIDTDGNNLEMIFPPVEIKQQIITAEEYMCMELVEGFWLFQTSSYFYKREIMQIYIDEYNHRYPVGDLPLVLLALQFGDCFYVNKRMSCYTKDSGGIMSKLRDNTDFARNHYGKMIEGHKHFNEFTKGKYSQIIIDAIKLNEIQIHKLNGDFRKIIKPEYKRVRKKLNIKNLILIYFGSLFPKTGLKIFRYMKKRNRNG